MCVRPVAAPAHRPQAWLGIDVAQRKLDVVLLGDAEASRFIHRVFPNHTQGFAQLLAWLGEQKLDPTQVQVCLEATGSYSLALTRELVAQQVPCSVLNPAVLVAYRQCKHIRSKTDALDARLLATYGRDERPGRYWPLPEEVERLRQRVAYRQDVLAQLQQARNRRHAAQVGQQDAWLLQRYEQEVQSRTAALEEATGELLGYVKAHEALAQPSRLLQSICGIGALAAACLVAEIGDIRRFGSPGALVSLAGLAVRQYQSGTSVQGKPCIDRHGRRQLRHLLYMCALTSQTHDPAMRAWTQRLKARGKPAKIVLVAVMRKLLHIIYGVWTHDEEYDPTKAFPSAA
jgi:transposase